MKKLLITMMAILAFNVSYAASMGEEQGIPDEKCYKLKGDAARAAKESIRDDSGSEDKSEDSSVING